MDTRSRFGWSDGPGATWDKTNTELNWFKEVSGSDDASYTRDRDSGDDDNNNWYEDGEDNPSSDEDDEQSFMN